MEVERDNLPKAARRDSAAAPGKSPKATRKAQAAACVNSHPTFGKSFRQHGLAKIARTPVSPYLVTVIKTIDTAQGGPPPETSGAELAAAAASVELAVSHDERSSLPPGQTSQSEIENPKSEIQSPLLTPEEKCRILAQIVRVNPLDCFDETGAFDIARAKRVLPPGAVRHITIHETTRVNADGQPVSERRINLRLVDPLSALRLDDLLERRRKPTTSHSDSSSRNFSRRDFNLLRDKTLALEDADHSIELLKKALAEADDRELQLLNELDEKDRQLETTQHDTGCQPADPKSQKPSQTLRPRSMALQSRDQSQVLLNGKESNAPQAPSKIKKQPPSSVKAPLGPSDAANQPQRELEQLEALGLWQEIEDAKNSMESGAFSAWLKTRSLDPAKICSPDFRPKPAIFGDQKDAKYQLVRQTARPPPRLHPMSFAAQGIVKYI